MIIKILLVLVCYIVIGALVTASAIYLSSKEDDGFIPYDDWPSAIALWPILLAASIFQYSGVNIIDKIDTMFEHVSDLGKKHRK